MNVLSLFDGMSCGQIALQKLGIKVDNYFASEVDEYAKLITQRNFPNTRQIGDVKFVRYKDNERLTWNDPEGEFLQFGYSNIKIDLLIGGSPCQNLSQTVINNLNHNSGLSGTKSRLFYEYLRILREVNPKYFLLENVGGMKDVDKDIISQAMGVEPIRINSNLFSAQDRDRLYWTNIPVNEPDFDMGILLKDIVLPADEVPEKYWYKEDFTYNGSDNKIEATLHINGHDILKRVYNLNGKCGTLTRVSGGNHQKKVFQDGKCRKLTPLEYERLQNVPDNYTQGISDTQRYCLMGNGWTVGVIEHIFKNLKND